MNADTPPSLSVVIPAYNEESNLAPSLRPLWERLDRVGLDYELVVNDNSSDATGRVIASLAAENPRVRAVERRPPRGFGRAVRSGLEAARGEVIVIYMADASDDPQDVVRYWQEIQSGYDCVFGSRFVKGATVSNYPKRKLYVNRIVNHMMRLLFWTRFNDLSNAFKAYRAHVIRECGPCRASHFNITIEMSLSALIRNCNISQIPINWQGRTWGSTNLRLKEMGRRHLSTLLKIYAEKLLIRDDIIAETVAQHARPHPSRADLAQRVERLEERLEALERRPG